MEAKRLGKLTNMTKMRKIKKLLGKPKAIYKFPKNKQGNQNNLEHFCDLNLPSEKFFLEKRKVLKYGSEENRDNGKSPSHFLSLLLRSIIFA
jgi:hypothetical protein